MGAQFLAAQQAAWYQPAAQSRHAVQEAPLAAQCRHVVQEAPEKRGSVTTEHWRAVQLEASAQLRAAEAQRRRAALQRAAQKATAAQRTVARWRAVLLVMAAVQAGGEHPHRRRPPLRRSWEGRRRRVCAEAACSRCGVF